jgi:hypothetical protein
MVKVELFTLEMLFQMKTKNFFVRKLIHKKNISQGDAWGFGGARVTARPDQNVAQMPVERDAEMYNMNHKRRGLAIIFNHKNFDPRLGLKTRNGTDADRDNLR